MTEKIKFNNNLSKKLSLDTMTDLGPSDTQGIEIKSPGKMHWLTIKGETWDDIQTVLTTELYDPDGELSDYIIQVEDKSLLEKILNKADDRYSVKAIVRCCNWFGTEFIWTPSIKAGQGNSKLAGDSAKKAIEKGLNGNWVKIRWNGNGTGWNCWNHPGAENKKAEWSKMSDEDVIDSVFDDRIITSLDHEALIRNTGAKV